MSTIVFKVIAVSGFEMHEAQKLHEAAFDIFDGTDCNVTALDVGMNGVWSFAILPDGSKEGWPETVKADGRRRDFMRLVETTTFDAVEVHFGQDSERHRGNAQIASQTKER